jgi:hypothetical protein
MTEEFDISVDRDDCSAPALLAALEEMLEAYAFEGRDWNCPGANKIARAAIAKAKGGGAK